MSWFTSHATNSGTHPSRSVLVSHVLMRWVFAGLEEVFSSLAFARLSGMNIRSPTILPFVLICGSICFNLETNPGYGPQSLSKQELGSGNEFGIVCWHYTAFLLGCFCRKPLLFWLWLFGGLYECVLYTQTLQTALGPSKPQGFEGPHPSRGFGSDPSVRGSRSVL